MPKFTFRPRKNSSGSGMNGTHGHSDPSQSPDPSADKFPPETGSAHSEGSFGSQSPPEANFQEFEEPTRSTPYDPFAPFTRSEGEAIGVLYCRRCDRSFGNLLHFQRHYVFSAKHSEDPEELRDLYDKLWRKSWIDQAKEMPKPPAASNVNGAGVRMDSMFDQPPRYDEQPPKYDENAP